MNVNPFSYLIEKLKGKVDKSGDTMTGQLRINNNSDTPLVIKKASSSIGKVYLGFENSAETIGYFSVGANKKPYFTSGNGADEQIALKSDIPVIHAGRYDAGTIPANTEQTYTITFPYTSNPICSLLLEVPYGYGGQLIYHIQSYGNTSMLVDIKSNANVGLGILFHWIVVEAQ